MVACLPCSLLDLAFRALPHQKVIHPLGSDCGLFGPVSGIGCVDTIPLRVLLPISPLSSGRRCLLQSPNLHQSLCAFPQHFLLLSQVVTEIEFVFFDLVAQALVMNK